LQKIDEKERHILCWQADALVRAFALPALLPNPLTTMLILAAPDEGKFVCRIDDATGAV
jgi:hypothetical protein